MRAQGCMQRLVSSVSECGRPGLLQQRLCHARRPACRSCGWWQCTRPRQAGPGVAAVLHQVPLHEDDVRGERQEAQRQDEDSQLPSAGWQVAPSALHEHAQETEQLLQHSMPGLCSALDLCFAEHH